MIRLSAFVAVGLLVCDAVQAQTIIKVSPDRNTVTVTGEKGTATSTIVRDGNGGGTVTTRYQPKNGYSPMGSSGSSYQPMGQK